MYRRVVRHRVKQGEIRPYMQAGSPPETGRDAAPGCQEVELESLDLIPLAPYFMLLRAEERARDIIAHAETAAQQVQVDAARQAAAQAREEAKNELLPSLVAFANAGQALIVFEEQLVSRCAPQIVTLAVEIAAKIIGKAVAEDPSIVATVLERAKQEVAEAKRIRIWLHPMDLQVLSEIRPDLIQPRTDSGRQIEVVASEEVARGGCRLETEMGLVDATIPVQIQEIRRQLLDEDVPQGN